MQISVAILASLAASALGAPAADPAPVSPVRPSGLEKRTVGNVYFTTDINWGGDHDYRSALNSCVSLSGTFWLTISSFGPDPGTLCTVYRAANCGTISGTWTIGYPGYADLTTTSWNDRIGSFFCWESW